MVKCLTTGRIIWLTDDFLRAFPADNVFKQQIN